MKRFKRVLSMLLALVMTMGLCITATAEDATAEDYSNPTTVTITISDSSGLGHTYSAYRIFEGTQQKNTEGNADPVNIGDIKWAEGINEIGFGNSLKADEEISSDFEGIDFSAESSAKVVAEVISGYETDSVKLNCVAKCAYDNKATAEISGLRNKDTAEVESGYYLIVDEGRDGNANTDDLDGESDAYNAALLQITSNIEIAKKTDVPSVEKKVKENDSYTTDDGYGVGYNDVADYNIGDDVPFELIGTIPDMTYYTEYEYEFHDYMESSLSFNDDVKVYLSDDKKVDNNDTLVTDAYTTKFPTNNNEVTFSVKIDNLKELIEEKYTSYKHESNSDDKYIIVQYTAKLTSDAQIGLPGQWNKVWLTYSNNPNKSGTGKTPEDKVIVFTYEIDVKKTDESEVNPLVNVKFKMYKSDTEWVKTDDKGKFTGWAGTEEEASELISDDNGLFSVSGLDAGTYFIKEIATVAGYNTLENEVEVTVSADTVDDRQNWDGASNALTEWLVNTVEYIAEGVKELVNTVKYTAEGVKGHEYAVLIKNEKGITLPTTGGIGTTIFYIVGGALAAGSLILLVVKKRMSGYGEE